MDEILKMLKRKTFVDRRLKKQKDTLMKMRTSERVTKKPTLFKAGPSKRSSIVKAKPTATKAKIVAPKSKSASPKAKTIASKSKPSMSAKNNYSVKELKSIINNIKHIYRYHPNIRNPVLFDSIETKLYSSMDKDAAFNNIILNTGLLYSENPYVIVSRYNNGDKELKNNMRKEFLHIFLHRLLKDSGSKSKSKSKSSNSLDKLFTSFKFGGKSKKSIKLTSMYNKMHR